MSEYTVTEGTLHPTGPIVADPVRALALELAIKHNSTSGCSGSYIVDDARIFETYLRGEASGNLRAV